MCQENATREGRWEEKGDTMLTALVCVAASARVASAAAPFCDYEASDLDAAPVYVRPPCVWPSKPSGGASPFPLSTLLTGVTLLENATSIPNYKADTWYPSEVRWCLSSFSLASNIPTSSV